MRRLSIFLIPIIILCIPGALFQRVIKKNAYDATTWNGVQRYGATQDAIRDKIESMSSAAAITGGTGVFSALTSQGVEATAGCVVIESDLGTDNNDSYRICVADGGNITTETYQSGSWVAIMTCTNAGACTFTSTVSGTTLAASASADPKMQMSDSDAGDGDVGYEVDPDAAVTTSGAETYNVAEKAQRSGALITISGSTVVTLTASQINNSRGSPVALVAALGANTILEFVSAVITYDYTGAAFTVGADEDLIIEYADGTDISAGIETTGFLDQADDEVRYYITAVAGGTDLEASINQGFQLFNTGTGETADGGTSTVDVRITYRGYATGF